MPQFRIRTLAWAAAGPSPGRALVALPGGCRPALHDCSDGSGWSLLGWDPDRVLAGRLRPAAEANLPAGHPWPLATPDPALRFERAMREEEWQRDDDEPPLAGGWLGFLGFECAHAWERFPWLPLEPLGFPDYHLARYRQAIAWAPDGSLRLLWAEPMDAAPAVARAERAAAAHCFRALLRSPAPSDDGPALAAPPRPRTTAARYREAVTRLRGWIGAGELYQANLSHRLEGLAPARPRRLYRLLRRVQPTAMSSYWEGRRGRALLSWSPELFLRVRGAALETRPIKGTAPRAADALADRRAADDLEASPKERAELCMIVDMARNDLGRVARPGGVRVASAGTIETLPTVHHRVAAVRAEWDPGRGVAALLRASFPPASVTGAPKVRALRAIAELEEEARGPYCGSFVTWEPGWPRAELSVLIRCATVGRGRLNARVGAGIVWDSDPEREWQETLWKARYLEAAAARAERSGA